MSQIAATPNERVLARRRRNQDSLEGTDVSKPATTLGKRGFYVRLPSSLHHKLNVVQKRRV